MYNFLKLLSLLGLFFLIGTATSEDIETLEYECTIELTNNAFILTSLTDADILDATIYALISDEENNTSEGFGFSGYSHESLTTDTLPFNLFKLLGTGTTTMDTTSLPLGTIPTSITLEFQDLNEDIFYFKNHVF